MRSPPSQAEKQLPRYLTSFVGREDDIVELTGLLLREDVRLLTLIGPGGAGKTRLAVECVHRMDGAAWDDVWFIPLVAVRDASLVPPAIARAFGLNQVTGRPIMDAITQFLGDRRALIVIDNIELVTDAAPDLGRILAACPQLTMLVTSRIALRISGEYLMVLPPLQTPETSRLPLEQLREVDAIRLFLDRTSASGRQIILKPDNAADIVEICRRLDGLPLALELAAARCGILSPSGLLERLGRGPDILSGGPQDAPERHRSMRDAIAWSYDLLTDEEQAVFRRLAIFSGGFSLDAADAIVALPLDIVDAIGSLTAKSLIVPIHTSLPEPRFTMLETLREYGQDRLRDAGEMEATRDRHAAWFLQDANRCEYAWLMSLEEGALLLSRLQSDYLNYRDALEWLDCSGESREALQLAGYLAALWILCGHANDGRAWLTRLLALHSPSSDPVYVNALATLSWLGHKQGTFDEALRLAQEGLSLLRSQNQPFLVVRCLVAGGMAAVELGKLDIATRMFEEAIERIRSLDGPEWWQNWINIALLHLANALLMQGRIDEADARFHEIVARQDSHGYEPGTSYMNGYMVLTGLGRVASARGDVARAMDLFQQSLAFSRQLSRWNVSNISFVVRITGLIAGSLAELGKTEDAARLFGASCALGDRYGYHFAEITSLRHMFGIPPQTLLENRGSHVTATSAPTRHELSPDEILRAWDEGRVWTLETATDKALAASAEPPSAQVIARKTGLTPRELDVLRLVAEGHSNRAIANALSISERTVEHHVAHILAKLSLDSRTAAATFAVRQGLL